MRIFAAWRLISDFSTTHRDRIVRCARFGADGEYVDEVLAFWSTLAVQLRKPLEVAIERGQVR